MAYDAGTAWLAVIPSFEDIDKHLRKMSKELADGLNKSLGDAMPEGIKQSAKATEKAARQAGEDAGGEYAGYFADTLNRRLGNVLRALPKVEINADSSGFDREVAKVRRDIAELRGQSIGVDIDPETAVASARGMRRRLRDLNDQAPDQRSRVDLSQAADEIDAWVQVARSGGERLAREAQRAADEWTRLHQSALDENLRRERKAAEERNRVHAHALDEDLRRTHLILQEQGRVHQQAIDEDLRREYQAERARENIHESALEEDQRRDYQARREQGRIHQAALDADVRRDYDARRTMAKLHEQAIAEDYKRQRKAAEMAARVAEEQFGKTWSGRIQASIAEAFTALPDTAGRQARDAAEQTVKNVRDRLSTLKDQRIGVDVDADVALADLARLRAELVNVARTTADVQVQADTASAAAKLTVIERMAERLSRQKVDLRIEADADALDGVARAANFSLSRIEALTFGSLSLGTVLVPAAAAAAGAVGFIGTAAVSAAAGIGVLSLGFAGIGGAVKALNTFQQDAQKSAVAVAAAQDRVASATDSVSSANRSLANTRASAAESARRSAQQVSDAERAVGDARRTSAEAVRDATIRVGAAERDLARANVDAREAREGLTEAYRDASRALADLDSAVKRNALDQRQATLDIKEAKVELDKVLLNKRATAEEREQARITYERRIQQITDLRRQGKELAAEQVEAAKKGVAGSDQVVAARKRIADADQRVGDAQRSLADARRGVVQAQVEGARRVADAERRVAEASRAQAQQQRQSAFQVAQAQQGVISAQRQLRQALQKTGVAGGEALSNLEKAMANLTPTGQRFARFIFGLKDEFDGLRAAAADNLLPGVQSSIESVLPMLPGFQKYIGGVAFALGDMAVQTANFLKTDTTWRRFFGHVDGQTVPTLQRLGRITRDTTTGVLGLYLAFTGFDGQVGGGLEGLAERFATWSRTLEVNQGFQKLLAYIRENGPPVVDLLGEMVTFVGSFIAAAAPVGSTLVAVFTKFFEVLNAVPTPVLQFIAIGLAGISAGILAVNAATRLWLLTTGTLKGIGAGYAAVKSVAFDAMGATERSTDRASGSLNRFERASARARTASLNMRGGLASVGSFLAGPWGIAVAGAAVAVGYFAAKSAEQKQKVEDLASALTLLGKAYKETRSISSDAVKDVVAQSRELETLINRSNQYGVAVEDIARAAAGEKDAQDRVIAALRAKKEALREVFLQELEAGAYFAVAKKNYDNQTKAIDGTIGALELQFGRLRSATSAQQQLAAAQRSSVQSATPAQVAQRKVADAMKVLADKTADAATKAQALKSAQDALSGAAKSQVEAEEAYEAAVDNVSGALTRKNNSLDVGTAAGRANRDAVQALTESSVDMYEADIAAGVGVAEATRRHEARIAALRSEAEKAGASKVETEKLISTYGRVPTSVETLVSMTGDAAVDARLAELAIKQKSLEKGISMTESRRLYEKDKRLAMMASGGLLRGPGTGTSDDILLWGSNGEFMQRADAVRHYGVGFMEAINQRRIPKEALPGFAKGGLVQRWPFPVDVSNTKIPVPEVNVARSSGGIGSADMMKILRRVFPGLALLSGYRPGSRTGSGALSYHGRIAKDGDLGRAVDVPPDMAVFNWLTRNYPDSREIIFTPAGGRQVWNGKPHTFQDPFVKKTHYNHVHWAYDSGGYLPPGVSTVYNGTGKPEPVFTDGQWDQIATLARNNHAEAREVHHWNFREQVLDHGRLQAWADARDARARPGRPM